MKLGTFILFILFFQISWTQSIFPYEKEFTKTNDIQFVDISFRNIDDNVQLSGTLIHPTQGYDKIVMIVPGSGKDTRHSHFILAEAFLKNNIAVYRFDERGIAKSEGKYDYTATGLTNDLVYGYQELRSRKDFENKKIGILGHSLGGIASIGAFDKGCDFDFLIQMATAVENNGAFISYQAETNTDGFYSVKNKSTKEVVKFIEALRKIVVEDESYEATRKKAKGLMKQMDFKKGSHIVNPLIIDLMKQNYEKTYQSTTMPILYIVGTEDRIVSCKNETQVLQRMQNSNIEIQIIENVNHWLNEKLAPTKMDKSLYLMDKSAMNEIINWTLKN